MVLIFGFLSGVCIVMSRILNAKLSEHVGLLGSTFYNYVVGLSVASLFLVLSGETILVKFEILESIPPYAYLGGVVGILVVMLSMYLTSKISVLYLSLIIFIGQLIIGGFIDYVTLGVFSGGKIIGGILILIGLSYNMWVDFQQTENVQSVKSVLGETT